MRVGVWTGLGAGVERELWAGVAVGVGAGMGVGRCGERRGFWESAECGSERESWEVKKPTE